MRRVDRLEDLDETWQADVAAVAVPGDPQPTLAAISQHLRSDGLMVVALDQFNRGRDAREALLRHWAYVLPYREHAPEPVLFLLASNRRLGRPLRPIPPKLTRINTRYLPAMFLLGSDEARLLYGEAV